MLFVAEVTGALLIGFLIGKWRRALVVFAILYVLHAIPASLGWYGALSEWDDLALLGCWLHLGRRVRRDWSRFQEHRDR